MKTITAAYTKFLTVPSLGLCHCCLLDGCDSLATQR